MSTSTTHNTSAELQELVEFADGLSLSNEDQAKLQKVIGRLDTRLRSRQHVLDLIKKALSSLRFDVKLLLFDLQATRRERDELERRLRDSGSEDSQ